MTDLGPVTLRVTEVEAYLGDGTDPGSHAYRGRNNKNSAMFGEPFTLYTYLSYGIHTCVNIVCSPAGQASAILIRAGEIVVGSDIARARRGETVPDRDLARGPGRLGQALGIRLTDGGASLAGPVFTLELPAAPAHASTSPRTGVSGPGGETEFPWRFFIAGDRSVSPYRKSAARPR